MGSDSFSHAASQYRGNNDNQDALQSLREATGGVKVSKNVPALSNDNKQNAVIRLGMRRDMVAAIWEGVTLLEDPYTAKSKGELILTGVMLYAVKIPSSWRFFQAASPNSIGLDLRGFLTLQKPEKPAHALGPPCAK